MIRQRNISITTKQSHQHFRGDRNSVDRNIRSNGTDTFDFNGIAGKQTKFVLHFRSKLYEPRSRPKLSTNFILYASLTSVVRLHNFPCRLNSFIFPVIITNFCNFLILPLFPLVGPELRPCATFTRPNHPDHVQIHGAYYL